MNNAGFDWWGEPLNKSHGGFGAKGERATNVKLDREKVAEIKRLLLRGVHKKEIAARFDVSLTTIVCIWKGRRWADVRLTDAEIDSIGREND